MGRERATKRFWILALFMVTAVSCSVPLFSRSIYGLGSAAPEKQEKTERIRPAKLSGVVTLQDNCAPGYYQVRLQGVVESAQIQVDSQTDQSGRFSVTAPPGQYQLLVTKEHCGAQEIITLEENTEHMLAVQVQDSKRVEKVGRIKGRLPASVLVPLKQ